MTISRRSNPRQIGPQFCEPLFAAIGLAFTILLFASSARAEVLDKLEFPWEPAHYVGMVIVLGVTGTLAASKHLSLRLAGFSIAIGWATTSLWADPWFTPDIGPALRAELTAEQSSRWLQTILVQAFVPLIVTLIVFLARTLRPMFRQAKR
jgi:hypothetical protein